MKSTEAGKGDLDAQKRERIARARRRAHTQANTFVNQALSNGIRFSADLTKKTDNFIIEGLREKIRRDANA